jgi:hypothetical protein
MDENKGHNNMKRSMAPYAGGAPLDFFNNAPHFAYIYRKSEKIITALYMVTGLISDKEPLKWRTRTLAGELLALANRLKDTFSAERDELVHTIKSHVLEMTSLLDIARFAGLMSEMNSTIIQNELAELGNIFGEPGSRFANDMNSESLLIDKSFFDDRVSEGTEYRRQHGGHGSDPSSTKKPDQRSVSHGGYAAPRVSINKGQNPGPRARVADAENREEPGKAEKKEKRRESILGIVRSKGAVTIKDVSLTMREVSEKTIQRELLALVDEGILKKEGERRWSRYSLA